MAGRLLVVPGLFCDDGPFLAEFARGGEEEAALFATRSLLERWRLDLLRGAATGVIAGWRLFLFGGLARFLLGGPAPRSPAEVSRQVIMAGLLRCLAEEGRLRVLGALAANPYLAKEMAVVYAELRRGLVPRAKLLALAQEDPLAADLVLCFGEYEKRLAAAGWAEEEDLLRLALRLLAAGHRLPIRRLLVHGFTDFTPLQAALLRALARRAEVTVLLPDFGFHPGPAELRRYVCEQFPGWEVVAHPPTAEAKNRLGRLILGYPDPGGPDESVEELLGANMSALASLVARVAWAHLKADPGLSPSSIAVVRRERDADDGFAAALRRHGLPVAEEAAPLLSLNIVGTLLAALDCLARDWPRQSVLRLARGVFVGEEAPLADLLAEVSAAAGVVRTKAAWDSLLDLASPEGETIRTVLTRLGEGLALLPPQGTTADYLRALRAFIDFWQFPVRYWPSPPTEEAVAAYAAEMRGLERFLGLLAETAAAEEVLGEKRVWEIGALAAEVFRLAGETPSPSLDKGGIRLLDPSEIRGLRFRLVFLVGLNEGEFPKPLSEDWLLPDAKRQRLRGRFHGPELRRDLALREWQLLANVLAAAAERLYLCRTETDARGEETVPSVFLSFLRERLGEIPLRRLGAGEVLPESLAQAWDEQGVKARLLVDLLWREVPAGEEETVVLAAYERHRTAVVDLLQRAAPRPLDGTNLPPAVAADLGERFGSARIVAISALEDYAACPFLFFARRILRLEEEKEVEEDLEGTELGQAYHAALERFFRQCGGPLVREKLPFYERLMAEAVTEAFAPLMAGARTEAAKRIWEAAREGCLGTLLRLLRAEIRMNEDCGPHRVIHCELGFGLGKQAAADPSSSSTPLVLGEGELRLSGKIDRVDLLADGHYVIYDYKLGRVPAPSAVLEGRALQIPLYLLAGRRLFFPQLTPAGAGYYSLRELTRQSGLWRATLTEVTGIGPRTKGSLAEEEWETTLARLEGEALAAARRLRAGDFRPLPAGEDCPSYCPFPRICRKEGR
ncbi:MAG: PD-(D/E)XK nuclease family protein [Bacillota bacterium]